MYSVAAFLISSAQAQTPPGPAPQGGIVDLLIPMALMFAVFYFLLIRPQQKQRKQHAEMIAGIKRGDTVVTAGGLIGKVAKATQAEDPEVLIELADGLQVKAIKMTLTEVRGRTQPVAKEEKK
ncbi:MAG: preprotein translocase subunit YajC [Parvularcula sp.]